MWSFISYLGRAQPPPSFCFYGVSAIMEFLATGDELQLFGWGPIYLLPQNNNRVKESLERRFRPLNSFFFNIYSGIFSVRHFIRLMG